MNVSTRLSHMNARKCSDTVKDKLTDPSITVQELEQLMTEFVRLWKSFDLFMIFCFFAYAVP